MCPTSTFEMLSQPTSRRGGDSQDEKVSEGARTDTSMCSGLKIPSTDGLASCSRWYGRIPAASAHKDLARRKPRSEKRAPGTWRARKAARQFLA